MTDSSGNTLTPIQKTDPLKLFEGWQVIVAGAPAELYFGDGTLSTLDPGSNFTLTQLTIAENSDTNLITRILVRLDCRFFQVAGPC